MLLIRGFQGCRRLLKDNDILGMDVVLFQTIVQDKVSCVDSGIHISARHLGDTYQMEKQDIHHQQKHTQADQDISQCPHMPFMQFLPYGCFLVHRCCFFLCAGYFHLFFIVVHMLSFHGLSYTEQKTCVPCPLLSIRAGMGGVAPEKGATPCAFY